MAEPTSKSKEVEQAIKALSGVDRRDQHSSRQVHTTSNRLWW